MTTEDEHPYLADLPDERWQALARFVAGECTPDEAAGIRRWLDQSPDRRAALERITDSIARLAAQPSAPIDSAAALERVRARMGPPDSVPLDLSAARQRRRGAWRTALPRIAAAIVLLSGAVLTYRSFAGGGGPGTPGTVLEPVTWTTAVGQIDSIALPDGSRVILGPGSRLALNADFGRASRTADLEGEALFDVIHDVDRPFMVRAGHAAIHDLGTVFNVRTGPAGAVTVAVAEGSVVLSATDASTDAVTLSAGDRGRLTEAGLAAEPGAVTAADHAWTEGRLVFVETPIRHVAATLERWYGFRLVPDPALADRHLTATFEGEPADQVLAVIQLALGATLDRSGDTVRLSTDPTQAR